MSESNTWRRCSNCKSDIEFRTVYWVCSVSTCNRKRTGLVFCSTECWDAHLPLMRHREAWAVEETAPSSAEAAAAQEAPKPAPKIASTPEPVRRIVRDTPSPAASSLNTDDLPEDILIVASKLKKYIKARSGMNTSDGVMRVLSDQVRKLCDAAIENADRAERKTVMDRDF